MPRVLILSSILVGFVALAACLGGCTPETDFGVSVEGPELSPGAPTALDVSNTSGNIFVRVEPWRSEPKINATLRSVDPSVNPRPATQDDGAIVTARSEFDGARQVLRVSAQTPYDVTGAVQLDLDVRIPSCEGIRIQNAGGYVRVWGVSGAIEVVNVATPDGKLPARFVEVRSDQPVNGPVDIRTSDDDIYYVIGANSSGTFDITVTPDHAYSVDHRLGTMTNTHPEPHRWRGVYNGGTRPIRLDAASGDVLVRIYERPMRFKSPGIHTP